MSAIGLVWRVAGEAPASLYYDSLQAALAKHGSGRRFSWADDHIAFGGISSGLLPEDPFDRQPLWNNDPSICLIADVRLDNRVDLARELDLANPSGMADSALLMEAWLRWGEACVDHLLGGFAFAVWMPRAQQVIAIRDHTGERPLFYHNNPRFFALASMPKGLLALPGVFRGIRESHLAPWFAQLQPTEPASSFVGIEPVPAGHLLRVTRDSVECRRYWHPTQARPVRFQKDEEYAEALVEILDRATEARLRSTRPVGSLLSAGLDSSSVTASAAILLGREGRSLTAYTAVPRPGFDGSIADGRLPDEAAGAAEVTRLYPNIQHVLVDSRGYDFISVMRKWSEAQDEPSMNVINQLWFNAILDHAREQGIGVMMEGQAGNGTISWYTWSILGHFFRRGEWPSLFRTARSLHRRAGLTYKTSARFALRDLMPRWLLRRLISQQTQAELCEHLISKEWVRRFDLNARIFDLIYRKPTDLAQERSFLFEQQSPGPLRAAAEAITGIEVRDPTADKRVYEFCYGIPLEQYIVGGHSRSLVRRAMKDRLPDSVRLSYRRGLQGADWYLAMTDALPQLRADLEMFERSPMVLEAVDVRALRGLLENWPQCGFHTNAVYRRWHWALVPAISLAYFLHRHESAALSATP